MTGKDEVEFKIIGHKIVGSNAVVIKIEDGTTLKITIDINRVAKAISETAPDGSAIYNADIGIRQTFIPAEGKLKLPRDKIQALQGKQPKSDGKGVAYT